MAPDPTSFLRAVSRIGVLIRRSAICAAFGFFRATWSRTQIVGELIFLRSTSRADMAVRPANLR